MPSKINYGIKNLESWNPLIVKGGGYHCTKCSIGCQNCWAEAVNMRFGNGKPYDDRKVEFMIDSKVLSKPYHWKKPRVIFVCNMGDLFHEQVDGDIIHEIDNLFFQCPEHQYLILTKRPQFINSGDFDWTNNLWLGLTICNQQEADEKLPYLLKIPAKHKWLSLEPLLGPIKFKPEDLKQIDWVVVGCESRGNKVGRLGEFKNEAYLNGGIRDIDEQCRKVHVPFFSKQISVKGILERDFEKGIPLTKQVPQGLMNEKE